MADLIASDQAFALKGHIQPGDPAPWWSQGRHRFIFDQAGGRYIVLCFYGNARDAFGQAALRTLQDNSHFHDNGKASFFCVGRDPADKTALNVDVRFPSLQFVWDLEGAVHQAYGVGVRMWIILDPLLSVIDVIPFKQAGADTSQLLDLLDRLPPPSRYLDCEAPVPVLILPRVFEPEFCRHLIDCYHAHGGRSSGFMQETNGQAVETYDPEWKSRKDCMITDDALIGLINARLARRLGAGLQRAFHFAFTRIERHLIACYSAEDGGHFGPHRDDTVKATEHRRFAVSINLNDDFDGGEVGFPEFGPRSFKAPVGAALVFSGSLLHQVGKVTRGQRHAFLPFLYDEAAEKIRLQNLRFLSRPADPAGGAG
jgi:predicted 2-oxoglutarate/Fe(II)-dependent dioxygenase YbiX